MTDVGVLHNLTAWPRWRRILWTGPRRFDAGLGRMIGNPGYKHGRYMRRRQWRLEEPLNRAMRDLDAFSLVRLNLRIARLPKATAERAKNMLDRLGEFFPGRWALQDTRPRSKGNWYVPRASLAICARWLRMYAALKRLVVLGASLISPPMPTPNRRGETGPIREALSQGVNDRRRRALDDYKDWCARQGLSLAPTV